MFMSHVFQPGCSNVLYPSRGPYYTVPIFLQVVIALVSILFG